MNRHLCSSKRPCASTYGEETNSSFTWIAPNDSTMVTRLFPRNNALHYPYSSRLIHLSMRESKRALKWYLHYKRDSLTDTRTTFQRRPSIFPLLVDEKKSLLTSAIHRAPPALRSMSNLVRGAKTVVFRAVPCRMASLLWSGRLNTLAEPSSQQRTKFNLISISTAMYRPELSPWMSQASRSLRLRS